MIAEEKIRLLTERARITAAIRRFFDAAGFTEVTTPVRIAAPAPEEHIDCPPVTTGGFLRASPEIEMKKLLALGMEKIYQIGPCFRDGEKGSRHNPEFTMIEWYRKGAGYLNIASDLEDLLVALGVEESVKRLTVRGAYRDFAGWDPWEEWDQDRFDFDMATKIEPALKGFGGVFLMDYPLQAASLSKARGDVAERWEFYYNGLELANCFTELCDAEEQRRRFGVARQNRRVFGEAEYPVDESFFECLPRIESAAGVALGVDRLVMVLTKVENISAILT